MLLNNVNLPSTEPRSVQISPVIANFIFTDQPFVFAFVLTLHFDQQMRHREFSADAHQLMISIEMTV